MSKKEIRDIADPLFQMSIRIDKVIWILGCVAFANDELRGVIEDDEDVAPLLGITEDEIHGCTRDPEGLASDLYMKGKRGFLIQAATPTPEYAYRSKSYHRDARRKSQS